MYRSPSLLSAICLGVFILPVSLFCQTLPDPPLAVDAQQMRHALSPRSPHSILRVYNLVPGNNYHLVLSSVENLNGCLPTAKAMDLGARYSTYDPAAHGLSFRPSGSTMDFQLDYSCNWDQGHPPTQYVSIVCENCTHKKLKEVIQDAAILQVAGGQSAEDLIRNVLVGGNCFDVSNITYAGRAGQIGTFSNGNNNIGFSTGVVMATGSINTSSGPNNLDDASGDYGNVTPDVDLSTLTTSNYLYDMADIEFDFTPTQSPASFQFVFASEEYCEFVNSPFNDVFGFFISGPGYVGNSNIALIPSTTTPVTINNVNHLSNSSYFVNNTGPAGILCGQAGALSPSVSEVQFDGFTTKLTATAVVEACQTYHIKLKVADVEDGIYDSAVFLNARSFDAGGNASVEFVVNGDANNDQIYEGCGTVQLVFRRVGANPNSALVIPYSVSGTAVAGLDYVPLPNSVVIPAGQNTVTIPVIILTDALPEAQETLVITLADACSCLNPNEILYLNDRAPLQVTADTVKICGPGTATLTAVPAGGVSPFSYLWNNGLSSASISPFDTVSTNYTVIVTDACGTIQVATAHIHIDPLPKAGLQSPAPPALPRTVGQPADSIDRARPF